MCVLFRIHTVSEYICLIQFLSTWSCAVKPGVRAMVCYLKIKRENTIHILPFTPLKNSRDTEAMTLKLTHHGWGCGMVSKLLADKAMEPGVDPKHPLNKGAKCLPAISAPGRQGQVRNPRSFLATV